MPNTQAIAPYKFPKGKSGNPNGRPKGSNLKSQIQQLFIDMMQDPIKYGRQTMPFIQAYKKEFIKEALSGGWSAKILAERLFSDNILEQIETSLNRDLKIDTDFLTYRVLKSCHDVQQKILLSKNKDIRLMAGRRSGKSEANRKKGIQVALSTAQAKILYLTLTFDSCVKLYFNSILEELADLGWEPEVASRSDGYIKLENGSEFFFKGNSTQDDREKLRGFQWDLVVIDEVQSHKALYYLLNDIIQPTLIDRQGQLILSGTAPRVRGTYWEELWTDNSDALKLNWSLKQNPFIPNYTQVLDDIKKEKGLDDNSPLFQREYLGKLVYDDDALVYRLSPDNYYTDEQFIRWVQEQPITDVHITAGIDYGWSDADGVAIVAYSDSKPEIFLIWQYKARRTGITELVDACKKGIEYVNTLPIANKQFYFYADTGGAGKKISFELATQYGLPVLDAYKAEKLFAIEQLQEQVRKHHFKVKETTPFADECLKIIWRRDDKDNILREIDDDAFHGDILDALLYALRPITLFSTRSDT